MKEKILIIEDDEKVIALLKYALSKEGYIIETLDDISRVEDVKNQIINKEPDLILSDIFMQPDGFDILNAIKDDTRLKMIPFIFISGIEPELNEIKAYMGGADNYITKPINNEELFAKIGSILTRQRELEDAIYFDPLTQIYNRRYFNKELKRQIKLHERHNEEFSVAFLDLDHFKFINDTYGHTFGDQCLVAFADFVKSEIRSTDIFARWGGEEFFLILERSELRGAMMAIIKMLNDLRSRALLKHGEKEIVLSFSAGIAQFPHHGQTYKALVDAADKAVYRAKELGRGRVEIYQPEDS